MVPLKEILNHTTDKYRTTVAAQKTHQKIIANGGTVFPEDRREKTAVTALRYVFLGKTVITDKPDPEAVKPAE